MARDSCPVCDQNLDGDEQFCPACGQELSASTCPECGTSLAGTEQFCPKCGAQLDTTPGDEAKPLTCGFTLDVTTLDFIPPDPESTDRDYASHALDHDELEDGVWFCDHPVARNEEYCLFHSSSHASDTEFATAMADRVSEADTRLSLVGATIPGIDLAGHTIDTELDLRHTTITGDVTFEGATIRQPMRLTRSHIDGDVTVSDAELRMDLDGEGTTVAGSVYGSNASFARVDFAASEFDGTVNFTDASFDAVDCSDARFNEQTFFQGLSASTEARFAEAWFSQTHFNHAHFESDVSFRNSHFSGPVTMNEVVCDGTGTFQGATFMRTVSFDDATFSQQLDLMDAKFLDDVTFDGVTGDISTFDTEFKGSVSGDVAPDA